MKKLLTLLAITAAVTVAHAQQPIDFQKVRETIKYKQGRALERAQKELWSWRLTYWELWSIKNFRDSVNSRVNYVDKIREEAAKISDRDASEFFSDFQNGYTWRLAILVIGASRQAIDEAGPDITPERRIQIIKTIIDGFENESKLRKMVYTVTE